MTVSKHLRWSFVLYFESFELQTARISIFNEIISLESMKNPTHFFPTFGFLSIILPKTILSYFIYFTTDSGSDAFQIPLLMW